MTTNIIINHTNCTITLTSKKFAAAASRYDTEAYKELQGARKDYPEYRVVTKSAHSKKTDSYKGLTYQFMESYIKSHDDENGSTMAMFNDLRATSEEAKVFGAESASYGEIRTWFLRQYPAFADFQKKRDALLTA